MMGITLIVCLLAVTTSGRALTDDVINCSKICKSLVHRRFKSLLVNCDCSVENENYFRHKQLEDNGIYFEPTDLYTLQRLPIGPPFYILNPALKLDFSAPKNIKKRRLSHYNKTEYKNKKSSSSLTKPTEARKRSLYLDIDLQDGLEIGRTATIKTPFELSEKDFMDCVNVYTLVYSKSKTKNITNIPNVKNINYSEKDTLAESKQLVDIIREKCSRPAEVVRQSLRQITNTWRYPQNSSSESSDLLPFNVKTTAEREVERNGMYPLNISNYQNYEDVLSQEVAILSDKNQNFPAYLGRSTVESEESFVTEYAVDHPIKTRKILHKRIFTEDTSAKKDTANNKYPLNSTNILTVLAEKGTQLGLYNYSDRSEDKTSLVAYKNDTDEIIEQSNSSRTNRKSESDVNSKNPEHIKKKKTSDESFTADSLKIPNNNKYNSHKTGHTEITYTNNNSDLLTIKPKNEKGYYTTNTFNLNNYYDKQTAITPEFNKISTQLPENINTVNKNNLNNYYDKQTATAKVSELSETSTQLTTSKIVSTLERSSLTEMVKNYVDIPRISSDELHSTIMLDSENFTPKLLLQYSNEILTEVISSEKQNETNFDNSSYNPVQLEITEKSLHQTFNEAIKSAEDLTENNGNNSIAPRSTATENSDPDNFFASTRDDNNSVTSLLTYPTIYRRYSNSLSPSADTIATNNDTNKGYHQINLERQESGELLIAPKLTTVPMLTDVEQTSTTVFFQQENSKVNEENTTSTVVLDNNNNHLTVDKDKLKYVKTDYNKLNSTTSSQIDMENYTTKKTIQDNSSENVLTSTTDVHNSVTLIAGRSVESGNITVTETDKLKYNKTGIIKEEVTDEAYETYPTESYKDVVSDLNDINNYSNNFTEGSYQKSINNYFPLRIVEKMDKEMEYTGNNFTGYKNNNFSLGNTVNMDQQIDSNASVKGKLFLIFNKTNIPAKFVQTGNGELSIGIDGATLCAKLNTDSRSSLINVICNCFLYSNCTNSTL